MVEVGNIEIAGTINTEGLEAGFSKIKGGLRSIADSTKPVLAELIRIGSSVKAIIAPFLKFGAIGVGFFTALAASAPAVAGAMASMKVSFGELTRSLGRALKPAFDLAAKGFSKFVDLFRSNESFIRDFTNNTLDGLVITGQEILDIWNGISNLTIPILDIKVGDGLKSLLNSFGSELVAGLLIGRFVNPTAGLLSAGAISISKGFEEIPGGGNTAAFAALGVVAGLPFNLPGVAIGASIGAIIGRALDIYLGTRKNSTMNMQDGVWG